MSTLNVGTIKSISSAAPVFQNTSGTEKGQLAKVWIDFNLSSSSIRDSFNVSSITDNGTGFFTITFSNAMSNTNYTCVSTGSNGHGAVLNSSNYNRVCESTPNNTTSCSVACYAPNNIALVDIGYAGVVVFGDS